jgi:hypothetical protein
LSFFLNLIGVITVLLICYKLTHSTKRIKFLPGSYQAMHKGICYKIDPKSDTVEMTVKLKNFKYKSRDKEWCTNLINHFGVEKVQKKARTFLKLLLASILLFLFVTFFPTFIPEKLKNFLLAGKILLIIFGIVLFFKTLKYKEAIEYYGDSYCEKCEKHLVLEEFQNPLLKEESRTDAYIKTFIRYWRCKNCGYENTKVEPQYINHHYERKLHKLKNDTCKQCDRLNAIEEYRFADVIRDSNSETKRIYYRCKFCDYHEVKIDIEVWAD